MDLDGFVRTYDLPYRRAYPTVSGTPSELHDVLGAYVQAGVDEFVVPDWNLGTGNSRRDALDRFMEEVAAPFRTR